MKKKLPFLVLLTALLGLFYIAPNKMQDNEKTYKESNEITLKRKSAIVYNDANTSLSIIVIVAVTGITIVGGYIYLKKGD